LRKITKITAKTFHQIETYLIQKGQNSDKATFAEVKHNLERPKKLNSTEFAEEIIYVILVAGFRQQTAKKLFYKIIDYLKNSNRPALKELLQIFNNKNKTKAILKVWNNRQKYTDEFYSLKTLQKQLNFLQTLPYIGNITKFHIARNLGLDCVKHDIWIQRLGVCLCGSEQDIPKINNTKLHPDIQKICDKMFHNLTRILNEKKGYIDVVLWKACQQNILHIDKKDLFLQL
jgi:hypothetical protein